MGQVPNSLLISGIAMARLEWQTWGEVCDLHPKLVSRDNPGRNVNHYHDTCGNVEDGPFIELTIPKELSALQVNGEPVEQVAYHGDFIVRLSADSILVVPGASDCGVGIYHRRDGAEVNIVEHDFPWRREDFPLYSTWTHRNGIQYIILGYMNEPEPGQKTRPGYPVTIRYANLQTGKEHCGPAWDWHRRMTKYG